LPRISHRLFDSFARQVSTEKPPSNRHETRRVNSSVSATQNLGPGIPAGSLRAANAKIAGRLRTISPTSVRNDDDESARGRFADLFDQRNTDLGAPIGEIRARCEKFHRCTNVIFLRLYKLILSRFSFPSIPKSVLNPSIRSDPFAIFEHREHHEHHVLRHMRAYESTKRITQVRKICAHGGLR